MPAAALTIKLSPSKLNTIRPSQPLAISPTPIPGGGQESHSSVTSTAPAVMLRGSSGHDSRGEEPSLTCLPPLPKGLFSCFFLEAFLRSPAQSQQSLVQFVGRAGDHGTGGKPLGPSWLRLPHTSDPQITVYELRTEL